MRFEVQHGSFGYRSGKTILSDVSFDVNHGEVMSVLGSNGVGKTTLLKCTLGFRHWSKGITLIDGKPMADYKPQEIWKRIGYVPQAKQAAFSYTVEEMVLLGRNAHLGLWTQPDKEDMKKAEECLDKIGMSRLRGHLCNEISGGELQMVLIARALAADPELLILDEPESNLDFKNQLIVINAIRNLSREQGIAAIVNTHYPEHALYISDKALVLNRDTTSIFGRIEEVVTEPCLRKAFDVDVRIRRFNIAGQEHTCVMPIEVLDREEETEEDLWKVV